MISPALDATIPSDIVDITSSPSPTPRRRRVENQPFDPAELGDDTYRISISIEVHIDGDPSLITDLGKSGKLLYSLDINDPFEDGFDELREKVEERKIASFAYRRGLSERDHPVFEHWVAYFGAVSKSSVDNYEIRNSKDWKNILAELRKRQHTKKECIMINIRAFYHSVHTSSSSSSASKKKNKQASRDRIRRTPLYPSDQSDNDDNQIANDDAPSQDENLTPKPSKKSNSAQEKSRDTSTTRLLRDMEDRNAENGPVENTRKEIFRQHQCTESRCSNFRGCCYILASNKSHHPVDLEEQTNWAKDLVSGVRNVTLQTPPIGMIARFSDSANNTATSMKNSGKKSLASQVPSAGPVQQPVEIHNHYPAPTPAPQPIAPIQPGWIESLLLQQLATQQRFQPQPQLPPLPLHQVSGGNAAIPQDDPGAPSSPLQTSFSQIAWKDYGNWLAKNDPYPDFIHEGTKKMAEELYKFSDLKHLTVADIKSLGIKGGPAIRIKNGYSSYKKELKSAEALNNLRHAN